MVFPLLVYISVAVVLTVWLALTLSRNGRTFLADVFPDRPDLAKAVNELLVVGFYMLNLGWGLLLIDTRRPEDTFDAVIHLATRLGLLLVTLGAIHFLNLLVFERIRRSKQEALDPPYYPPLPPGDGGDPARGPRGDGSGGTGAARPVDGPRAWTTEGVLGAPPTSRPNLWDPQATPTTGPATQPTPTGPARPPGPAGSAGRAGPADPATALAPAPMPADPFATTGAAPAPNHRPAPPRTR